MGTTKAFAKGLLRERELFVRDGSSAFAGSAFRLPSRPSSSPRSPPSAGRPSPPRASSRPRSSFRRSPSSSSRPRSPHARSACRDRRPPRRRTVRIGAVAEPEGLGVDSEEFTGTGGPYQPVSGDKTSRRCSTASRSSTLLRTARSPSPATSRKRRPHQVTARAATPSAAAPTMAGSTSPVRSVPRSYATADGVVKRAGWNSGGYKQPRRDRPWPWHRHPLRPPRSIDVAPGQRISCGQPIAKMGRVDVRPAATSTTKSASTVRAVNPIPFMKSTGLSRRDP